MAIHLQKEIEKLKKMILALGARVEENVRDAIAAIQTNDVELAASVRFRDKEIDAEEINIEEECLKVLALHQPVATDLRFIISILKINTDLERISDLANNIAKRVKVLKEHNIQAERFDFAAIGDCVRAMVRKSLLSLVNYDTAIAQEIINGDDVVDSVNKSIISSLKDEIKQKPAMLEPYLQLILVSRYLERMADCTTNIAEDVIYMIQGNIVRHSKNGTTKKP